MLLRVEIPSGSGADGLSVPRTSLALAWKAAGGGFESIARGIYRLYIDCDASLVEVIR